MSQNMSKHTQDGLSLVNSYIQSVFTLFFLCFILLPLSFIAGYFAPVVIILIIINIIYFIVLRCKIFYRSYEFYKLNTNNNSLYSPTGAVIADFIPILDLIRQPKLITEILTNKQFTSLNNEGNKYKQLLILVYIFSISQSIIEKSEMYSAALIFSIISFILSVYFFYFEIQLFRKFFKTQNDQALVIENLK